MVIQKIISEFVTVIKFTKKCDDQNGVPWIKKMFEYNVIKMLSKYTFILKKSVSL